ncbi:MAG: hypothetical protein U0Z44_15440 [Kouleothrix sp.]
MFDTTQPDALIAATFRQVLDEAGPRQAAVLQYCAIPHWFDAEVLAVLRERADGNDRVIELLRGYSFVRPVGAGRYAYQDDVRAALLAEWRAERASELGLINRRLAAHFAARVAAEQSHEVQLPAVTITMRPACRVDVWRREALYHLLQADPAAGPAQLRDAYSNRPRRATGWARPRRCFRLWPMYHSTRPSAGCATCARGSARSSLHLDDAIGRLEALLAEPGPRAAARRGTPNAWRCWPRPAKARATELVPRQPGDVPGYRQSPARGRGDAKAGRGLPWPGT